MKLQCPGCEQTLALPDDALGRQARCPRCGAIFHVGPEIAGRLTLDAPQPLSSSSPSFPGFSEKAPSKRAESGFAKREIMLTGERSNPVPEPSPWFQRSAADPQATWELRIGDGRTFGPVDRATLDQWVREGRVGVDASVRPAGDRTWTPARVLYPYLRSGSVPSASVRTTAAERNLRRGLRPARGGWILFGSLFGLCCFLAAPIAFAVGLSDLVEMHQGRRDQEGFALTLTGVIIAGLTLSGTVLSMLGSMLG